VFPKSVKPTKAHGLEDCRSLNKDQIIASLYGAVQKLQIVQEDRSSDMQTVLAANADLNKTVTEHVQTIGELKDVCANLNQRLNALSIILHTHIQMSAPLHQPPTPPPPA
jgi:hypothetical protein